MYVNCISYGLCFVSGVELCSLALSPVTLQLSWVTVVRRKKLCVNAKDIMWNIIVCVIQNMSPRLFSIPGLHCTPRTSLYAVVQRLPMKPVLSGQTADVVKFKYEG